jgi:hypothetical protein
MASQQKKLFMAVHYGNAIPSRNLGEGVIGWTAETAEGGEHHCFYVLVAPERKGLNGAKGWEGGRRIGKAAPVPLELMKTLGKVLDEAMKAHKRTDDNTSEKLQLPKGVLLAASLAFRESGPDPEKKTSGQAIITGYRQPFSNENETGAFTAFFLVRALLHLRQNGITHLIETGEGGEIPPEIADFLRKKGAVSFPAEIRLLLR